MNKKLLVAAAACFFANAKDKLYQVTNDGQCFGSWHDANEHSKTIGEREVSEISREDCADELAELTPKKSLIDLINECETVDAVEALIKNNSPKAAKEAAAAKIEKLNA